MAQSVFRKIAIRGIAGAVPRQRVNNLTDHAFCSEEDAKKAIALTGVAEYRKAATDVCASDLCEAAARQLLAGLDRSAREIDAVIMVTTTPDYRLPSTACLLQGRLDCAPSAVAYDVNMGCSGFIVGLFHACSLIQGAGLNRVLLLTGDTQTKLVYPQDKSAVFTLADGGAATLLEADASAGDIAIELLTDGSRFKEIYVPAGGFRRQSDEQSREVRTQPDGGKRSDDHIYMNGLEVFRFAATDVVASLAAFLTARGLTAESADYLFLSQSNRFVNEKIARKLRFPKDKVPYSIGKYGNTGSAAIPLTIVDLLSQNERRVELRSVLCGFGVGLSWGMADLRLRDVFTPPVVEVQ